MPAPQHTEAEYRQAWRNHIDELGGALAWDNYPKWCELKQEMYDMLEVRIQYLYKVRPVVDEILSQLK